MKHFPVSECRYCGSKRFYRKFSFRGQGVEYYNSDGYWAEENDGMYDSAMHIVQRTFFCAECDHKLFVEPISEWIVVVQEGATQKSAYLAGIQTYKGDGGSPLLHNAVRDIVSFEDKNDPQIKKFKSEALANKVVAELTFYFGSSYQFEVIEETEAE